MSTRACYSFFDSEANGGEVYHVYKHSDGYPEGSGGLDAIRKATQLAWTLPRFEADEFAAAFVAANKAFWVRRELELRREAMRDDARARPHREAAEAAEQCVRFADERAGGDVRLMQSGAIIDIAPCDIEYRYEVRCLDDELWVKVIETDYWGAQRKESELFSGTLKDALKKYKVGKHKKAA